MTCDCQLASSLSPMSPHPAPLIFRGVPWVIKCQKVLPAGLPYLSLFFLPLEELLVEPVRLRLPLESPELSLRPPGDTRSEELVLLMLQERQAGGNEASIGDWPSLVSILRYMEYTLRLSIHCHVDI